MLGITIPDLVLSIQNVVRSVEDDIVTSQLMITWANQKKVKLPLYSLVSSRSSLQTSWTDRYTCDKLTYYPNHRTVYITPRGSRDFLESSRGQMATVGIPS